MAVIERPNRSVTPAIGDAGPYRSGSAAKVLAVIQQRAETVGREGMEVTE
jgi:hypothetical protein